VDQLVGFLDRKHGKDWAIFEFRAEGTGYPDDEVYGRVHHFPWPDHHPPPFEIVPNIMAAMRNWIQRLDESDVPAVGDRRRIAVVHCKAGKGRSGTVTCSYLISQEGWKMEEALQRFTIRRMRTGFGQGVSIPSQIRWVRYVNRWTNEMQKVYVDRPVEITEVHVWGLRDGVKVAVEGFVDEGKRIHNFHTFTRSEKTVVDQGRVNEGQAPVAPDEIRKDEEMITSPVDGASPSSSGLSLNKTYVNSVQTVVLRPNEPLVVPTSDVKIDFERRNKASIAGFTMVTSVAHVWFNTWFEGGSEKHTSGLFEIEWDAMDGIKGSARKGVRAFDRLKVVWKYAEGHNDKIVEEPKAGDPVPEAAPADWKGHSNKEEEATPDSGIDSSRPGAAALTVETFVKEHTPSLTKGLGLRPSDPTSADVSVANSVKDEEASDPRNVDHIDNGTESESEGVKPHGPHGEDYVQYDEQSHLDGKKDTAAGKYLEIGLGKAAAVIAKLKGDSEERPVGAAKAEADGRQAGAEQHDFADGKTI
jgi:protein-tyrosine phosphatase